MIFKISFNKFILGASLLLPVLLTSGCKKEGERPLTALEAQGKAVFMSNCIACHNQDPRLVGSIGPEVADSSLELITARIMHQSYPLGYVPKRKSGLMPALPFLEKDIPAIHAYLNSFKKN